MKSGRWTEDEITKGLQLYAQGMPYAAIGIELDRSASMVRKSLKTARDRLGIDSCTRRPSGKSQLWLERYREATLGWPTLRGNAEEREQRFIRAVIIEARSAGLV
jgi:hypothetical protein